MLGLLDPGGEDNVYEELLAKINKNKMSANILTVTVVDALSKLVYVAKSKYDKAPPNMLSKRQFAHVLGYICRREMLLGWGQVDWVERVLLEAKLKNKTTLLFEIFRFERPIPRYLLKTVLPCKALGFSYGLITAVALIINCQ